MRKGGFVVPSPLLPPSASAPFGEFPAAPEVHNIRGLEEPRRGGSREEFALFSGKQVAVTSHDDFVLFFFFCLFSGPHPQPMEVPRLGGESEV